MLIGTVETIELGDGLRLELDVQCIQEKVHYLEFSGPLITETANKMKLSGR